MECSYRIIYAASKFLVSISGANAYLFLGQFIGRAWSKQPRVLLEIFVKDILIYTEVFEGDISSAVTFMTFLTMLTI